MKLRNKAFGAAFILWFFSFPAFTQSQESEIPREGSSAIVTKKKRHLVKRQRIRYLIKGNTKNTLYGNPCVNQVTREMGFEYLITMKGQQGYESEAQRWAHNFGVKMGLVFKNGPFWKAKLNKRTANCRDRSGDYVG
ncbi:MAG: hypothetical protein ACR2MX_02555 [Cyclobacteriaceae bacterium]